jgi:hypothetical protein
MSNLVNTLESLDEDDEVMAQLSLPAEKTIFVPGRVCLFGVRILASKNLKFEKWGVPGRCWMRLSSWHVYHTKRTCSFVQHRAWTTCVPCVPCSYSLRSSLLLGSHHTHIHTPATDCRSTLTGPVASGGLTRRLSPAPPSWLAPTKVPTYVLK